jgi:hypothetical protein
MLSYITFRILITWTLVNWVEVDVLVIQLIIDIVGAAVNICDKGIREVVYILLYLLRDRGWILINGVEFTIVVIQLITGAAMNTCDKGIRESFI